MTNDKQIIVNYNPHAPSPRNGQHWLIVALSILAALYCYLQVITPNREIAEILRSQDGWNLSDLKLPEKYSFVKAEIEAYPITSATQTVGPAWVQGNTTYPIIKTIVATSHQAVEWLGFGSVALSVLLLLCTLFFASRTASKVILNGEGIKLNSASKTTFWNEILEVDYVNHAAIPGAGEIVIRAGEKKTLRIRLAGISKEEKVLLINALKDSPAKLNIAPNLLAIEGH